MGSAATDRRHRDGRGVVGLDGATRTPVIVRNGQRLPATRTVHTLDEFARTQSTTNEQSPHGVNLDALGAWMDKQGQHSAVCTARSHQCTWPEYPKNTHFDGPSGWLQPFRGRNRGVQVENDRCTNQLLRASPPLPPKPTSPAETEPLSTRQPLWAPSFSYLHGSDPALPDTPRTDRACDLGDPRYTSKSTQLGLRRPHAMFAPVPRIERRETEAGGLSRRAEVGGRA